MTNLADGWDVERVKLVELGWVYGYADPASLRVDTEGALEEMVDPLGHVDVQPRVGPLKHYLIKGQLLSILL